MAVAEGGFGLWAVRLEQTSRGLHREARWLMADVGGPLGDLGRMAASDAWGGPFADRQRGAVRSMDHQITDWGQHLGRMGEALEQAAREAENAVRLEAAGMVPSFDVFGALAPWRRWPDPTPPLPSDWASTAGPGSVGVVWVDPDRARQLAEGMRTAAGQLRVVRNRVATALSEVRIDTPLFLEPIAAGLEDIAAEVDRRVTLLEQVDRELAGAFRQLAEGLGFPGLAPPIAFDPAEPIESAMAALRAGPQAGPGQQPTQAKEADPVSTSTGNFYFEAVDLAQPARGIPTVLTRTYNSLRAEIDGPLGFGWGNSWGTRLRVDQAGAIVVWGDGHEERHHAGDSGAFVAAAGMPNQLRRTGEGFELVTKAGVVHSFDEDGCLVAVVDQSSNTTAFEYGDGCLVRLIDASGVVTTLDHDEHGRITAVNGVMDRRWLYTYGRRGDLVAVTDPEGAVTTYDYDHDHYLLSLTDPEGAVVVRNTYDGLGRVVEQRDGAGGRWRYRYEAAATVVTDPLGHTKRFRFDERYRTTAITEANGATTRFWWDDASNLVTVEDPTGRTSRLAYNSRGDLTRAEGPASAPVHFEWDSQGNLAAVVRAEGQRAELTWDRASRPVRLVSPAGVTTTVTWRDDGLPESISDGDGGTTRYTFDAAGRLTSIIDPVGAVTTASFDAAGRPMAEAHPGGEGMTFTWDHCDRLVAVTDEAGATHRYLYDRCGRLTAITDPLGRVTRYAYGPLGLLASVTDPLGRETTFAYDACGRLATRTDARGAIASFSYDPAGRLVRIDAPGIVPITYGWDDAGRLVALSDATGESTWELDEAGRPAVEHRPEGIDLAHRYDTLGRRNRLEVRRAEALVGAWEYGFDPDGRITSVLDPSGATTRLGYDPAGRLASLHHPNGVMTTWAYDAAGETIDLAHAARDGTVLSSWTNAFDDDGNLVRSEHRQSGEPSGAVQIFDYDHLGRLTCVHDGVVSNSFLWDNASNQTGAGPTGTILATGYDDADQVTARDSSVFSHDQAGNLIRRTGGDEPPLAIAYDTLGRVVELRAGEEIVAFTYDGLGRRVGRKSKGVSTTRIFDSASVIAEVADNGLAALETTAGLLVLHRLGPSGGVYLHADANTNVSAVTDETGNVIARLAYTPFGARTTTAGDADTAAPFGFCGTIGVREDLVGLLDMRARLYEPTLGRFTSPDPWPAYLPEPVTLNRYLYALGDPISQVDPLGLFCWMGSKHGKCKGLRDVAKQAADVGKDVADFAEEPVSVVSKVAGGVAVVAAGVTAVCPVPCGPISGAVAGWAGSVSYTTGLAAAGLHCVNEGVTTFDCGTSVASAAISTASRHLFRTAARAAEPLSKDYANMIRFGGGIFGLFRTGATAAASRRK